MKNRNYLFESFRGLLAVMFTVFAANALSLTTVSVACVDVDDKNTCKLNEGAAVTQGLIDTTVGILQFIKNSGSTPPPGSACTQGQSSPYQVCDVGGQNGPLKLNCMVNISGNVRTGSCYLQDQNSPTTEVPRVADLLRINCNHNTSTDQGSCSITSDSGKLVENLPPAVQNNPNIRGLASAFLSCASRNSFASLQNLCDQLLNASTDQLVTFINQIQPINPDATSDVTVTTLKQAINNINERIQNVRNNTPASTPSVGSSDKYYYNNEWHEGGALFAQADGTASDVSSDPVVKSVSEYGKLGFFINGAAINAEQGDENLERGSETSSTVITLGVDYRFSDNMIGGIAYNIADTETEFSGGNGKLDTLSYAVTVYGSYYIGNFFVDGALTLGGDSYEQERSVVCTVGSCGVALNEVYEADYSGSQTSLSWTAGYDFYMGSFGITPFAQWIVGSVSTDAYQEKTAATNGNAALAFGMKDHDRDVSTINIGGNFRYVITTNAGVFIPTLSLQIVSEQESDSQLIEGNFVANSNPNSKFQLRTDELDSSYQIVGLGFTAQLKNGNAGFVNYQTIQGYDNLDQDRVTLGWRWEF